MSGRIAGPRPLFLSFLLPIFASVASAATPPPETFRDQLAVREAEIIVGLPPALQAERDSSLEPEDFVVRVGGELRKVIRLSPLARERSPWRLVVVIDPALAHPDTIVASLLALASDSKALAKFGSVDLAVAEPNSEIVWLGRNLSGVESIAFALAEAAGRSRSDRRRNDPHRDIAPAVAADRLGAITRFLLADPGSGPRSLALPLDSVRVLGTPAVAAGSDQSAQTRADDGQLGASAQLLSAYGWTVLPLGFSARSSIALDGPGVGDYSHWNDTSTIGPSIDLLGILRWLRGKRPTPPPRARVTIESEVLPERAAARNLAEATGGIAIDRIEQIQRTLDALGQRYVLGYEASAEPKTGEILPVAVASARGKSPAVSPHFARTGASESLADLILAGLLAGDPPRHELPVTTKVQRKRACDRHPRASDRRPAARAASDLLGHAAFERRHRGSPRDGRSSIARGEEPTEKDCAPSRNRSRRCRGADSSHRIGSRVG